MRWTRGSLQEVPWRRPTPYYRRLPAGDLEDRAGLLKRSASSFDHSPKQESFAESNRDPFATPKLASENASIRAIRNLSKTCSDYSTSSTSSKSKAQKRKRGQDYDDDYENGDQSRRPHSPFEVPKHLLGKVHWRGQPVADEDRAHFDPAFEMPVYPFTYSPSPVCDPPPPPRSNSYYHDHRPRSHSGWSSTSSRAQPWPLSNDQSTYDPALQSSLWDYKITYSRHKYLDDPPVSPKGTVQPASDWIRLPPPPAKRIRLGPHIEFDLAFQRRSHHTTSRLRHRVHKTRVAFKSTLSNAGTLLRRFAETVTRRLPRRNMMFKTYGRGRRCDSDLCIRPLDPPFLPGARLGPLPELRPHRYHLPRRALEPAELPGNLPQNDAAMFHHNLLVKTIRWGARPENEGDWLEWCLYRDVPWEPAGSIPHGWAQYSAFWGWRQERVEREERKRVKKEEERERKMSEFSWVQGDDGVSGGLSF